MGLERAWNSPTLPPPPHDAGDPVTTGLTQGKALFRGWADEPWGLRGVIPGPGPLLAPLAYLPPGLACHPVPNVSVIQGQS